MATQPGVPGYPARTGVEDLKPPTQKPLSGTWRETYQRLRSTAPTLINVTGEQIIGTETHEPVSHAASTALSAIISPAVLTEQFGEDVLLAVFQDARLGIAISGREVQQLIHDGIIEGERRIFGQLEFYLLTSQEAFALALPVFRRKNLRTVQRNSPESGEAE
jgi:hypothetical protein